LVIALCQTAASLGCERIGGANFKPALVSLEKYLEYKQKTNETQRTAKNNDSILLGQERLLFSLRKR
jgi:hypothetical protein